MKENGNLILEVTANLNTLFFFYIYKLIRHFCFVIGYLYEKTGTSKWDTMTGSFKKSSTINGKRLENSVSILWVQLMEDLLLK